MKKKGLLVSVLLCSLLLAGCKGLGSKSTENAGSSLGNEEVFVGTEGLSMNFVENLPPSKLYSSTNLNVLVELHNKGVTDINNLYLYLSGFDPNIIRIPNRVQSVFGIEGKSRFNLEGGYRSVEFASNRINDRDFTERYTSTLSVTACYDYTTVGTAVVCVDPFLYDVEAGPRPCQVQDVSLSGGQGAPVSVESIDVDSTGNEAYFQITLSNAADGKVVRTADCPYNLQYEDLNYVEYDVTLSGQGPIECLPSERGSNRVRLVDGRAKITCTFGIDSLRQAYSTPLNIRLDYGYMQSISTDVEIIKVKEGRRRF